ncbi:ABC transporter permease [Candidatus Uhrbacteria bacterium]|nr:ABC transporter permease [Candidatus Uhrbacteria bacterium]
MTRPSDIFEETAIALLANKARSGLTILGIVIGIASVIAMVSIGRGAQGTIQSSIEGLGSNLLTIAPGVLQPGRGFVSSGRGGAQTLKKTDADALANIFGVRYVSPEIQRRFQVTSQAGNNTNVTVIGGREEYAAVHAMEIENGIFVTSANDRSMSRVAVLGPTTAQDLFGQDGDPLGKTIRINKINFKVIGVLKPKGGTGFFNPDDTVIIPLSTMEKIIAGSDYLSTIAISVTAKDQMAPVKEEASALLIERHHVSEPDFSIVSQEDILGALSQVTTTFTLFLASIAGISLIVGGIGIMNMMLTAVTERTREIGLRKAIGARRRDISLQFLAEAIMLTFVGGVIGITLGWMVAVGISRITGIATIVSLQSIVLACSVSAVIGIVFGYYPAQRAAGLNPIDALRYE